MCECYDCVRDREAVVTDEDRAAREARMAASEARFEAEVERQRAWVATWTAAHECVKDEDGVTRYYPKEGWVWPNRGSVKDALREAEQSTQVDGKDER